MAFLNWCRDDGRLKGHDLARLPKADERADPRRRRRALTEPELVRLLSVAAERPLRDARTVRRGRRRGEAYADLASETVARLRRAGRERSLIYKTLVLTGLRVNELRTLTLGQLHLEPGAEFLQLDAADEKSGEGNAVPLRADLAADIRGWLADELAREQANARDAGKSLPAQLSADRTVFAVPMGYGRSPTGT